MVGSKIKTEFVSVKLIIEERDVSRKAIQIEHLRHLSKLCIIVISYEEITSTHFHVKPKSHKSRGVNQNA